MDMSPAQKDFLHSIACALREAPPAGGARAVIVARAAETLGCSVKTVYARLKKHTGWTSGKKKRTDAGKLSVSEDVAMTAAGVMHTATRVKGKRLLSIKHTRSILQGNGLGNVNPETGEVTMPSAETLSRAMRAHGCHPKQLAAGKPTITMRSLHPNQIWQVDASVCVLFYLPGGKVSLMDEKKYYKNKLENIYKIAKERVVRYVVTDHTSGSIFLRYEQQRGEDARGVIDTLIAAMCDRGPRDPMKGAPFILLADKGGGNTASLMQEFLGNLHIRFIAHATARSNVKGSVEKGQDIVERNFEGLLRFKSIPDLATLQGHADAWRRHFNAHAIHSRHKKSRNAVWLTISDEQLRTVERPVLEAIAHWGEVTRQVSNQFTISVDTRAFGMRKYDLRELGYHGLCAKDTVRVRLNPFKAPVITVMKTKADGTELIFDVAPIEEDVHGFDSLAPVIGEEFRSLPDTRTDKVLKEIRKQAYDVATLEEADKAAKSKQLPYAHIDVMADIREAPLYMRGKGQALQVGAKTAQPMPLNHVQAAARLREMCVEAWEHNAVGCMDLIKARYPQNVPENALQELASAMRDRFMPKTATILTMPARPQERGGDAVCANA